MSALDELIETALLEEEEGPARAELATLRTEAAQSAGLRERLAAFATSPEYAAAYTNAQLGHWDTEEAARALAWEWCLIARERADTTEAIAEDYDAAEARAARLSAALERLVTTCTVHAHGGSRERIVEVTNEVRDVLDKDAARAATGDHKS